MFKGFRSFYLNGSTVSDNSSFAGRVWNGGLEIASGVVGLDQKIEVILA